jgi:predicted transcriptional regulator
MGSNVPMSEREMELTDRLAEVAVALQELRYHVWVAIRAYDRVSLRKAQHRALDGPMEALRMGLPVSSLPACTEEKR